MCSSEEVPQEHGSGSAVGRFCSEANGEWRNWTCGPRKLAMSSFRKTRTSLGTNSCRLAFSPTRSITSIHQTVTCTVRWAWFFSNFFMHFVCYHSKAQTEEGPTIAYNRRNYTLGSSVGTVVEFLILKSWGWIYETSCGFCSFLFLLTISSFVLPWLSGVVNLEPDLSLKDTHRLVLRLASTTHCKGSSSSLRSIHWRKNVAHPQGLNKAQLYHSSFLCL